MPLMQWNEHFATGIAIIDEQHRWLIDLVNASAPVLALNSRRHHEQADDLLDQLMNYAAFHFQTEEGLMRGYAIDARHEAEHQQAHGDFVSAISRMRAAYTAGEAPTGATLLTFLANWLIFHILGEDQALARQLRAIDGGRSPADAFAHAEGSRCDPTHEALTQALIDAYTLLTEQNRNLMENNDELERHRHRLEELVSARTGDLVRALDAAEAANKARSSFIANMSHEIRTPMNAIVGITWALKQNTQDPAQLTRLHQVGEATQQLLAIINDLLDMARIESDRLTLAPLDFAPAKVLREVLGGIADKAAAKGLHVTLDAPDLPPLLRGDPVRLGQILANYASNATKFTERGTIAIRAFPLPGGNGRLRLRFEIEDTGIGIDPNDLPRLFEPFEQGDSSSTRRHGGTGLGLAISRRLAEMMGGRTGADSAPGRGSTFWLELPFEPLPAPATPAAARPAPTTVGTPPCRASRRETLQRLAALLADDDVQAIALWHESAESLAGLFDRQRPPFEAALTAYDFAAAHALLMQVADEADEANEPAGSADQA
ncbi:MAG: bacteriohemerythrin [Rhodocyclales bacterium]|nr:bacteriohemerythrin [Rhodocyclales bacterium]